MEVEDYAIDETDDESNQTILKRTLKLTSKHPRQNVVFRVANGDEITKIDDETFRVGGSLRIRIGQKHAAEIVNNDKAGRLIIPLNIPSGDTEIVLYYIW